MDAGSALYELGVVPQSWLMVDQELSRAVVAYVRGSGLAWPHRSPEAVAGVMGAEVAERLMPRLKQLADEAFDWPVDWRGRDLDKATRAVETEFALAHPELDQEAVLALGWDFSYGHR
jgi:hypothetical protein